MIKVNIIDNDSIEKWRKSDFAETDNGYYKIS